MFSTGHKMLQRARSLRRVHHDEQPAHKRQTSASSDASRASSSGSDSSSSRENTPEWDPLRLHPSMEVDRSPHITPVYHENRHHHHHYHHQQQHHHQDQNQHEGSRHPQIVDHQAEYHPPRHTQQEARLQVYGGFDFGFEKPQPLSPADSDAGRHRLRAPRSETDLHRRHDAAMAGGGVDWHGLPSPVRRTRPAGYDEADFFIKRGGWKRRGIVFGSSEPTHDAEDNCFDVI